MKYYKTESGIRAIGESTDIDGDQSKLVQESWELMTALEIEAHANPPITLEQAKATKLQELETAFITSSKLPITVGIKTYNGGKESAQALRDYIQLVTESGGTSFTIWDSSNSISTYTLAEATAIKLAVATEVAQGEFNLRMKKNTVNDATTITAVNAVTY